MKTCLNCPVLIPKGPRKRCLDCAEMHKEAYNYFWKIDNRARVNEHNRNYRKRKKTEMKKI